MPDTAVLGTFAEIPALLERDPALILRGRLLDCECLLGPMDRPFHVTIRSGVIVDLTPIAGPDALMAVCLSRDAGSVDGVLEARAAAGLA